MDELKNLSDFHWKDAAAIEAVITHKIPRLLTMDQDFQNARRFSDTENIRIEVELAIQRAISAILSDYIELFQQFTRNPDFKERLISLVIPRVDLQPHD